MNPRLTAMTAEFEKLRSAITTIETKAANEGRDLSDHEQTDVDQLYSRAEALRPEIEAAAEKVRSLNATADILSRVGLTPKAVEEKKADFKAPSVGEYVAMHVRSYFAEKGDRPDSEAQEFMRAAAQQGLADNSGVVPTPIIGDLIKFVDPSRPALNSFGTRPMFVGTSYRPRVTQHTSVAVQSAEFAELASQKMLITKDALSRATYGGYVEISEQDMEFTDPGIMQIIMQSLAEQYGVTTGNVVADALVTAATNTYEEPGGASALTALTNDELTAAFWAMALQVYSQCKKLPDTLWVSTDMWANIGARVDTTDRPLYPGISPTNASGTMEGVASFSGRPVNLNFVVDPNFASGTVVMGRAQYGEVYETIRGTVTGAFKPSTLATEVGYYGNLGTYFRAEGFVRLINAA